MLGYKKMHFSRQLSLRNVVLHFIKLVKISTERAFRRGSPLKTPAPRKQEPVPLWILSTLFVLPDRRICHPGAVVH